MQHKIPQVAKMKYNHFKLGYMLIHKHTNANSNTEYVAR